MKFAVIGTSAITEKFLEALSLCKCGVPYGVYSRSVERGQAFAHAHGITQVFSSLEDLCQSEAQAVYVASPNYIHAQQATALLQSGKSVLLEKPACVNLPEWEALLACANTEFARSGVILAEAMRPHFDVAYDHIRALLPSIAPVRRVTLEFCQYSSRYDAFLAGNPSNTFTPALGNAALLDIGVYPLHMCIFLFGVPKTVRCDGFTLCNGMEGGGTVLLGYDGFCAEVIYSKVCQSVSPSVICAEKGAITIDKISEPDAVWLHRQGGERERLPCRRPQNNMVYEIEAFCRAIQTQTPIDHSVTTATIAIMDEVRRQRSITFD